MSYTRFGFDREFVKGESNLYSYYSTLPDGSEVIEMWSHGRHIVIDREDFFELIMRVLERAGVKLTPLEMFKLATELKVVDELRDKEEIITGAIEEDRARVRRQKSMIENIHRLQSLLDRMRDDVHKG